MSTSSKAGDSVSKTFDLTEALRAHFKNRTGKP